MERYNFKVFTIVLWQLTTNFAPLTRVFQCAMCKQGRVDTPESWHTVFRLGHRYFHNCGDIEIL